MEGSRISSCINICNLCPNEVVEIGLIVVESYCYCCWLL
jgi:hypothetical protein